MSDNEREARGRSAGRQVERPARLRDPVVIARQRATLATGAAAGSPYSRGARDALGWLLTGGRGPLTGDLVEPPVSARAIVHELAAAEAGSYEWPVDRERPIEPVTNDRGRYAAGVEHALMWAVTVTTEAPRGTGLPATASGGPREAEGVGSTGRSQVVETDEGEDTWTRPN
jgi:hypothetical protein